MPQPSSPPYVLGAQAQPRQLVRWLDVNPQNGPLTRFQNYITLPTFSVPVTWRGYSEIVASFNFEGPNAFILQNITSDLPLSPNYALAISWRTTSGKVFRYFLWTGVGEVIYFSEILYNNQVIKKNFRFEVWSTNNSPAVNNTPINFYTSVLGDLDYRYSNDQQLIVNDTIVTQFQSINSQLNPPADIGIAFRWNVFSGITAGAWVTKWVDSIVGAAFTNLDDLVSFNPNAGLVNPTNTIQASGSVDGLTSTLSSFNVIPRCIALGFITGSSDATLWLDFSNNTILYKHSTQSIVLQNTGSSSVIATVTGLSSNVWYTVIASNNAIWVFNMLTGELLETSSGSTSATIVTVGAGIVVEVVQMVELIIGTNSPTATDAQNLSSYFTSTYMSSLSLPLTFPLNSLSQGN